MIRFLCPLAFVLALGSLAWCEEMPSAKPEDLGIPPERVAKISSYVQNLVDSGEVPGAVAIVTYKGKVILHQAVGKAEQDPSRPMKRDTIFRIASMTKPITSVAVMMLVEEGKIALDDPVSKFIPKFAAPKVLTAKGVRKASQEIKIRHLLTHTSGLGYPDAERIRNRYEEAKIETGVCRSPLSLDKNIERLAEIPLLFDPGEKFNYGMSTDVLGLVVEKASEMKLATFIEEKICKPLGMHDTFFQVPADKQHRLAATCFFEDAKKLRELGDSELIRNRIIPVQMSPDYPVEKSHRYVSGGGGLSSTAEDYLKFCQMILNGGTFNGTRLLETKTVKEMTKNQIGDLSSRVADVDIDFKFGLGFSVFPQKDGMRSEIGWGGIWGTVFRISQEGDWAGILLTQRVFDESFGPREESFTKTVREAIQGTTQVLELPTAKPGEVGVSSSKVEGLSTFMQSLVDQGKITGGVTMMARHDKVIHLKAVGMADRKEKKPMEKDAIFRIASMSKPMTSVAIMMLYEQGKLKLDDPVSKFIPAFKNPKVLVSIDPLKTEPAKEEITIRHLLTHMAGLGYTPTEKIGPIYVKHRITTGLCTSATPLGPTIDELGGLPLLFQPGVRFQYGMSTDVLGRVVEVASGQTLDRFIDERICRPLGMNDTCFKLPPDKHSRLVAAYYPEKETGIRKLEPGRTLDYNLTPISSDYPVADAHKYFSGGGGLCSTATDYMRFCQMLLNGGQLNGVCLLQENTVKMMRNKNYTGDPKFEFGFGFTSFPDAPDVHEQLRGAYAWFGFWSTSFRISPKGDWALVTMTQVAYDDKTTTASVAEYERIAAESIEK